MNEVIKRQRLIKYIKDNFERLLAKKLGLIRVSAPLLVLKDAAINDDLGLQKNGITFYSNALKKDVEIVQSLAKWKRLALYQYDFVPQRGLYTDMNAIRPHDPVDKTHSLYIDQWDWEQVITATNYNLAYLKKVVNDIYQVIKKIIKKVVYFTKNATYKKKLPKSVYFISSQELLERYPNYDSSTREDMIAKAEQIVFVYQIGYPLSDGSVHSMRAVDYDNWQLNGDLIVYHAANNEALELSSMGIRVRQEELIKQANSKGVMLNWQAPYYKLLANNTLPLTIGGGIGQSRLCQYLLNAPHIGMVQASVFSADENKKYQLL